MANRLGHLRQTGLSAASVLLLGAAGCAFPNGTTGGDPLLGNFNRPIVPTPPPERGGLGPDSPAYDAGARIGVTPPDVPVPGENTPGFMTLPNLTFPNLQSKGGAPAESADPMTTRKAPTAPGAKLPMPGDGSKPLPLPTGVGSTSGPAFVAPPPLPRLRTASHEDPVDPGLIRSVEDGHAALEAMGAKGQRLEQTNAGDWRFSCVRGSRLFEARETDRLEAVRNVFEQVRKER